MSRIEWGLDLLLGVIFILGALSFSQDGAAKVTEFVSTMSISLSPTAAKCLAAAAAGLEMVLGVSMILKGGRDLRRVCLYVLVALTAMAIFKGTTGGWALTCGCLSVVWEDTVLGAVIRNVALVVIVSISLMERFQCVGGR